MGVPVLSLFRENKIRESQYYCHSRNLKSLEIYALYGSTPHSRNSRSDHRLQHNDFLYIAVSKVILNRLTKFGSCSIFGICVAH